VITIAIRCDGSASIGDVGLVRVGRRIAHRKSDGCRGEDDAEAQNGRGSGPHRAPPWNPGLADHREVWVHLIDGTNTRTVLVRPSTGKSGGDRPLSHDAAIGAEAIGIGSARFTREELLGSGAL
jgi:hypothetical protein